MKTILDTASAWLLDSVNCQDKLTIVLVEDCKDTSNSPGKIRLINVNNVNKVAKIVFGTFITWHCINVKYTVQDKYEISDSSSFIRIISRSKYTDYIDSTHGWYNNNRGPAKLYQISTGNILIEIVSFDYPSIKLESY